MAQTGAHFLVVATEWGSAHGGLSTFNRRFCTQLAAEGVRVSCLVLEASGDDRRDAAARGVTLVAAPRPPGASSAERLTRRPDLGAAGDPQVIIGHARITGPAAHGLKEHFPEAKRVHFIHMIPDDIERHKLDRGDDADVLADERHQAELALSEQADLAVAVGPRIHSWFLRDLEARGFDLDRLLRFDPGFDDDGAAPRNPPRGEPWMVLLFGRAEDERLKGLDIAAAGFAEAARRLQGLPEIELVIRGARPGTSAALAERAREWARDRALNIRVKPYTTHPARLADELRAASLVVMPSRAEGFGLVGAEAIVARTPVLVSSASGLGSLLEETPGVESAWNVVETTSDDDAATENWSRAIEAVLKNRKGAFAQAEELHQGLAEKVTWSGSTTKFLAALDVPAAPAGTRPAPDDETPVGRGLPQRLRAFVGREELLSRIGPALAEASPIPVVLHGPGGVGKSSLAVEYAYRSADEYDPVHVVAAENPGLIASQLAELGTRLGVASVAADADITARATIEALQKRRGWLLVFDNVESPDDLLPWLPSGPGHVLVTSRAGGWGDIAHPISVEEFHRTESIALLTRNVEGLPSQDADRLAGILGDLPLALAQVSGVLNSGISAAGLQELISAQAAHVLELGATRSYGESLAAVTLVTMAKLADASPMAANLLSLCSYLAPEPILADWFRTPHDSAADLGPFPQDALEAGHSFTLIRDKGLGRVDFHGLRLHRLTQVIIRDHTRSRADAFRTLAADILNAAAPEDTADAPQWPEWKRLTPHLLAIEPRTAVSPLSREITCKAARYLILSGQTKAAVALAADLHHHWTDQLGADHPDTLIAAQHHAHALRDLGDFTASYDISQDTLERHRRTLGADAPHTLMSANNLAANLSGLGRSKEALPLHQDTHERRLRILGENHSETLLSADNLAGALRAIGRAREALPLAQDTYERRRQILGENHPETLMSANNLATILRTLGRSKEAHPLAQDSYERHQRILGEDHPNTLSSANNFAGTLHEIGQSKEALSLAKDAYERHQRIAGEDHPNTLISANNLAGILRALKRSKEALPLAQGTYERHRRVLGEDHPDTLSSANNLAVILGTLKRAKEALPLAQDTYERNKRVLGDDHPNTLLSANNLAGALHGLGRYKEALSLAQDAYERHQRILGKDHPHTLISASNLVAALKTMGKPRAAHAIAMQNPKKQRKKRKEK